jgi:two-component system, chemotaxis family, protein-glutamate methylesterase/glutaminase
VTVRVLLVDDSAVIRGLMSKALSTDSDIEIVGTAANGQMAVHMVRDLKPDVVVLDIEMPVMDGITALPVILKEHPGVKVIMASTLTVRNASISMEALSLGAADYLAKPSAKFGGEVDSFYRELSSKVRALAGVRASAPSANAPKPAPAAPLQATPARPAAPAPSGLNRMAPSGPLPVIDSKTPLHVHGVKALAIASSTGGPQALMSVFEAIRGRLNGVPIFITQHMPPTFTTILAEHIAKASGRPCIEAKGGEVVQAGHVYLAPGDYHMVPEKDAGGKVLVKINQDPPENYCRPAADPMLRALSTIYGRNLAVVVLTGMGQDGMLGAKIVVQNGGSVIAQDEASCVVYGMPRAVVENGLCRAVLPLTEIGQYLISQIEGR